MVYMVNYGICTVCLQIVCLSLLMSTDNESALQNGILYKMNSVPVISATRRQGVKIVYAEDFRYEKIHFSGCFKVFRFKHAHGKAGQPVLRCQASIRLLRLPAVIDQWVALQKRNGYFFLDIKELNIIYVRAEITERTSDYRNSGIKLSGISSAMVTGIFSKYVWDAREYIFQNMETGIRSTVMATPTHRFYVKNKKAFIPIGSISSEDNLVNSSNQRVRLLFSKLSSGFPGKSVNFNVPVKVYNMEIDKKHTYFAGAEHIMVHNVCKLTYKDIYNFFETRGRLRMEPIDKGINELSHNLQTLRIYMIGYDIEDMRDINASRLLEGEADRFSYAKMFRWMGFCELMPFDKPCPYYADYAGLGGDVTIRYLKYPFFKSIYEDKVLSCITEQQSFDMLMQKESGRTDLCYADFYKLIEKIDPDRSVLYKKAAVDDRLATLPVTIQPQRYKLAL